MRAEPDAMLRSGRLSLSVEASAAEKRLPFTTKLLVSGTEALRSQPPPLRHTRLHFAVFYSFCCFLRLTRPSPKRPAGAKNTF